MKLKTRKSAAKRIKIKKQFLCRKNAYKSHLLKSKNSKRLRRLSSPNVIHSSDLHSFSIMLPYL
jgi:large subunit ribosomal protein L35